MGNKIKGTIKETADFRLLIPKKWEFVDFSNGCLQTYNSFGSYVVSLKKEGINMTEKDVEVVFAGFVQTYKGSGPDPVEFKGLKGFKSIYDFSGMHQSMYVAYYKGQRIEITLSGVDHETNEIIQAVFDSVEIL
jgi:hypothetical protein